MWGGRIQLGDTRGEVSGRGETPQPNPKFSLGGRRRGDYDRGLSGEAGFESEKFCKPTSAEHSLLVLGGIDGSRNGPVVCSLYDH